LPSAVKKAKDIKNYWVWSNFAEKEFKRLGFDHVKTVHGAIESKFFYKLPDEERKKLRLKNVEIIKSVFPDNNIKEIKKIKICHIDVNTYQSTLKSFMYVHKRLISNGIIIFDDYGTFGNDNIKKFISKIIKKYKKDYFFIFNFFGQCILLKK
jgi:hypothetical protein